MSKKKVKQAPQHKAPMTKRELSRWQKQKKQERLALGFVIATIAVVAGIILFGIWREILSRPSQVVARVGSTSITLGNLSDEAKYRAKTLDRQIELTNSQLLQAKSQAQSDSTSSFLVQYIQQQVQQLALERAQLSAASTLLEELVERELIRQEVLKRGSNVTADDVTAEIQLEFQPTASASETVSDTTAITDTVVATPAPSPTPVPADAWKTRYQDTLKTYNITDPDFRRFTIEPVVWRQKLIAFIGTTVPTTTEQVKASHILVATEEEAKTVLGLLAQNPPPNFGELAAQYSTDSGTNTKGGDLGWFPRGVMDSAFEVAAFALQPGQVSGVVSTTFGFHIIKLESRDANHPLTTDQLDQNKTQAFSDWLSARKTTADIQRYLDSDKQTWLNKQLPAAAY